jgi:hypothetical protein
VLGLISRTDLQIGAVAGFLAVGCVLAFAAGWRQWSERHGAPTSAARLVSLALVASAGATIIGYGLKGPLAIYPGPVFRLVGRVVAAAGVAWLALTGLTDFGGIAGLLAEPQMADDAGIVVTAGDQFQHLAPAHRATDNAAIAIAVGLMSAARLSPTTRSCLSRARAEEAVVPPTPGTSRGSSGGSRPGRPRRGMFPPA